MNPTEKQLQFAKRLGLDVPEGITKAKLSAMLSEAVMVSRRERRSDLPTEIALAGVPGPSAWRQRAVEYIRKQGIRLGSLVKHDRGLYVVVCRLNDPLDFGLLEVGSSYFDEATGVNMINAYTPPATHVHPLYSLPFPTWIYKQKRQHRKRLLKFVKFVEERIQPDQTFRNEHGTFWSVVAVAELKQQFVTAEAAERREPKQKVLNYSFCVVCGNKHRAVGDLYRQHRCRIHLKTPTPAKRFCYKCGEQADSELLKCKKCSGR